MGDSGKWGGKRGNHPQIRMEKGPSPGSPLERRTHAYTRKHQPAYSFSLDGTAPPLAMRRQLMAEHRHVAAHDAEKMACQWPNTPTRRRPSVGEDPSRRGIQRRLGLHEIPNELVRNGRCQRNQRPTECWAVKRIAKGSCSRPRIGCRT